MFLSIDGTNLRDVIRRFIEEPETQEYSFNDLAVMLASYQYGKNQFYGQYVDSIIDPRRITQWTDIPAMPVSMFKEFHLRSYRAQSSESVWWSSGTTGKMSKTYLANPTMYSVVIQKLWREHVLSKGFDGTTYKLIPPGTAWKNSSLAYFFDQGEMAEYKDFSQKRDQRWFRIWQSLVKSDTIDDRGNYVIDTDSFKSVALQAVEDNHPLRIVGTSYAIVWLLESVVNGIKLPEGSMLIDTGGYKGKSTEYSRQDFLGLVE